MKVSLRRYTELAFLVDYLRTQELALVSPASWDDWNDSYFIDRYLSAKKRQSAYALCLAESEETYHHWKVFTRGTSGVCIHFLKDEFVANATKVRGLRAESVTYKTLNEIRATEPRLPDLPFLKRYAFIDEKEFRLFLSKRDKGPDVHRLRMPLTCIERITLSPWLPKSVAENVKATLKETHGCSDLRIYRSTLLDNSAWRRFAEVASDDGRLRD